MEYTTIFRSDIVYAMGEQNPLSIVAIQYTCITQIPCYQAAQPILTSSLRRKIIATDPVTLGYSWYYLLTRQPGVAFSSYPPLSAYPLEKGIVNQYSTNNIYGNVCCFL